MKSIAGNITPEQTEFNTKMSSRRVSFEQSYKDLKQMWVSQDFAHNLEVRKAPIAPLHKESAIICNFRTCFYSGGQVAKQFRIRPA